MDSRNKKLTDPVKTGEWFSKILKERGWLEHEVAEFFDVSEQRAMNWANGKRGMRLSMIIAICYVYGINEDPKNIFNNLLGD